MWDMELAVIRFAEFLAKESVASEEFLHERKMLAKTLAFSAWIPSAMRFACQACIDFGMKVLYHHFAPDARG